MVGATVFNHEKDATDVKSVMSALAICGSLQRSITKTVSPVSSQIIVVDIAQQPRRRNDSNNHTRREASAARTKSGCTRPCSAALE